MYKHQPSKRESYFFKLPSESVYTARIIGIFRTLIWNAIVNVNYNIINNNNIIHNLLTQLTIKIILSHIVILRISSIFT